MDNRVYGYVNGCAVSSADEYVYKCRGFGPIETDEELLAFAEKASHHWYDAGWRRTFTTYYLSDYALSEPRRSLTNSEFNRLLELQRNAIDAEKAADNARCWVKVSTFHYADNSVEEVWRDKDGIEKTVMTVYPHGD